MGLPENVEDILPLSPVQNGMLFHAIGGDGAPGTYVGVVSALIEGPMDTDRFIRAFREAMASRDAFRACFVWKGVKSPVQVIRRSIEVPCDILDWRDVDSQTVAARLDTLIDSARREGFDLTQAPLMRLTLIRLGTEKTQLVWPIHHIISDGWSTASVLDDVLARYVRDGGAGGRPRDTPASFRDYLVWLRQRDQSDDKAYWSTYLDGVTGPARVEAIAHGGSADGMRRIKTQTVEPAELERLDALARDLRITQNTLLSAAWSLILRRYTRVDDVVFGLTTSGRPAEIRGIDRAAGAFINTLPVRLVINPDELLTEHLRRAGRELQARAVHEFASLADVQKWAGRAGGEPLFDILFVHERLPMAGSSGGPLKIKNLRTVDASNYSLALLAKPDTHLRLDLYFDPTRYSVDLIDTMLSDYVSVLTAVAADANRTVRQIMATVAPVGDIGVPEAPSYPLILEQIATAAHRSPDAEAVSDDNRTLTYGELESWSDRIAGVLQQLGVAIGAVIPVAVERGVGSVAAFLGVMKAGASYVPLDLEYPGDRLQQILTNVNPSHIITSRSDRARIPEHTATEVCIDELPVIASRASVLIESQTPAYVIFTSGSQGRPKGVVISHGALAHSTGVRGEVYGQPPGAFLLLSSFSFDSSVVGLYWTLTGGGRLVIASRGLEQNPTAFGQLIADKGITHTLCLPGLYDAVLGATKPELLASLETVIVAGEALVPATITKHRSILGASRLFNEYGPTEAAVWCTCFDTASWRAEDRVSIGRSIPGVMVHVIDPDGFPVPQGVTGELAVEGPTLALGYLHDLTQTKLRFRTAPSGRRLYLTGDLGAVEDGRLYFLGREDDQVKIRGHRVEMGEIEGVAAEAVPGLECAAVILPGKGTGRLVACLAGTASDAMIARVQDAFETALPPYARPGRVVAQEILPRLPNGKIDRAKLATQVSARHGEVAAGRVLETDAEVQLAKIWADILNVPEISRDANFFDLGGDSLKTITFFGKAEELGYAIDPNDIFEHPTLRGLASHLIATSGQAVQHHDMADLRLANLTGQETPVFLLHGNMALFSHLVRGLGKNRPVGLLFSRHFESGTLSLSTTVEEMAAEALRALRQLKPAGPYILCGYSAGAVVALEMARQLKAAGETVDLLSLVDPPYDLATQWQRLGFKSIAALVVRAVYQVVDYARAALDCLLARMSNDRDWYRRKLVDRATSLALRRYRPTAYAGPVYLQKTEPKPYRSTGMAIETLFDCLETERLPFSHSDLLNDPQARSAAVSRLIRKIKSL